MGSTVMTVCPIRILSPFFSHWVAWMRRPFSQVPLVEPRSSTYHRPRATWKRAWRPEANSSSMTMDLYGHLVDGNLWQAARIVGDISGTSEPRGVAIENADDQSRG